LYWSDDNSLHVVCTVSKRYSGRAAPYSYGYAAEWREFLWQGQKSFLIFGCVDRDTAYAIPRAEVEKVLADLHRAPDRHWHILLDENESGGLDLILKNGPKVPLNKFESKLLE
jgi:hypothetical protein